MTSYPIAETFISIQGEGYWTGTPMCFVRLAGCNVGKYTNPSLVKIWDGGHIPADPEATLAEDKVHSICTDWEGKHFVCDTNYHPTTTLNADQILHSASTIPHICITGGEPFLHDLHPIVYACRRKTVHIETSGTKLIPPDIRLNTWITCSPKAGFLNENASRVNEWKFLVDGGTTLEAIKGFIGLRLNPTAAVYLQPIGGVDKVWKENVDACWILLRQQPGWRLSAQLHKWLGMR